MLGSLSSTVVFGTAFPMASSTVMLAVDIAGRVVSSTASPEIEIGVLPSIWSPAASFQSMTNS